MIAMGKEFFKHKIEVGNFSHFSYIPSVYQIDFTKGYFQVS